MYPRPVIILGPTHGRYAESVAKGLRQTGLETFCYTYPSPPAGFIQVLAWQRLPERGITTTRRIWLERIVRRVREAARSAGLLIIIRGDKLPLDQYADLLVGAKCPKVLWLMDSIHRVKDGLQRANMVDALLYFEGTDLASLAPLRVPHHQVAMAADSDWYYPTRDSERLWDISFFGTLYENRLATLEAILAKLPPDLRLDGRFVGPCRARIHRIQRARRMASYPLVARHLRHGANLAHSQINRLNNESRICLNVLHPQSIESLNPRAFETCCSGAFLLSQANPSLSQCFVLGREVESFETPGEAADKIVFYLRRDDLARKVAAAGRERVLRDHTMRVRVQQVLSMLRSDNVL